MFLDMVMMVIVLTTGHVEQQAQSAGNCAIMRQALITAKYGLFWGNAEVHGRIEHIECRSLVTGRVLVEGDGLPGDRSKQ